MVSKKLKVLLDTTLAAALLLGIASLASANPTPVNPTPENPIPAGLMSCKGVPADDPAPAVEVCEDENEYWFRIEETTTRYPKTAYRNKIRQLVNDYAKSIKLPDFALKGSTVTFWLSGPEASPRDAWARAVISGSEYHFLVNLPIDLGANTVNSSMVANLGNSQYPEYLGHRVGSILVKKAAESSEEEFRDAVMKSGGLGAGDSAGGWTKFFTHEFSEDAVIQKILQDSAAKVHVAGTQLNVVFEWIAWREAVFKFNFDALMEEL